MDYLGFIASTFNKPVVFVFGNHNLKELNLFRRSHGPAAPTGQEEPRVFRNYFGSTYAGDRVLKVNNILIAGLGGSVYYNGGENQFHERQMWWKAVRLIPRLVLNKLVHGRYLDILLTHSPPRGIHDADDLPHRGFETFRWFVKRFKPRYLLHGHIHLYDKNEKRLTRFEQTDVINVYDHYVLEYQG
jgi:Icc-related predicted phosphoesterase